MSLEGKTDAEIEALATLADSVLSKPDTAGVFQRLVKRNNPDVSMPFVELEDRAAAAIAKQQKEIDELRSEHTQTTAQKQADSLYESLREHGAVSSRAGFEKLVTYASEQGFMTTEAGLRKAAMSLQQEMEAAEPTPATVGTGLFGMGTDDNSKSFMRNPLAHSRTVAAQAMDDIIKSRSKGKALH